MGRYTVRCIIPGWGNQDQEFVGLISRFLGLIRKFPGLTWKFLGLIPKFVGLTHGFLGLIRFLFHRQSFRFILSRRWNRPQNFSLALQATLVLEGCLDLSFFGKIRFSKIRVLACQQVAKQSARLTASTCWRSMRRATARTCRWTCRAGCHSRNPLRSFSFAGRVMRIV